MTNPPNTEGLTAEQIELLRSLPLKAERVSPEVLAEVKQNLTPFATWGTAFDRDKAWLTEVGERLLATIDTERERAETAENQLRELASLANTAWPTETGVTPAESRTAHDEITRRLCAIDDSIAAQQSNQEGAG